MTQKLAVQTGTRIKSYKAGDKLIPALPGKVIQAGANRKIHQGERRPSGGQRGS